MQPFNLYKNKGVVYNVIIESEVGCDEINIEIINKINELITNDDLLHIYFPKIGLGRIYPKYEIIKNIITFTFGISFKDINRNPGIDELSSNVKSFMESLNKNLNKELHIKEDTIKVNVLVENPNDINDINDIDKTLVNESILKFNKGNNVKTLLLTSDGIVEKYTNNTIDGSMPFSKLGVVRECKNIIASGYNLLEDINEDEEIKQDIINNPDDVKQDIKNSIKDVNEIQQLKNELDDKIDALNESADNDNTYCIVVYTRLGNDYEPDVTIANVEHGKYTFANNIDETATFDKDTAEFYAKEYKEDENNNHILKAVKLNDLDQLNNLFESKANKELNVLTEDLVDDLNKNNDEIDNDEINNDEIDNDDMENIDDDLDNDTFPTSDFTQKKLTKQDILNLDLEKDLTSVQLTWLQDNINSLDVVEQSIKDIVNLVANSDEEEVISIDDYAIRMRDLLNEEVE